jgi:hypothetical protein
MITTDSPRYASKIIKAGALLSDTKTLLALWDRSASVAENLDRFQRENLFGKASRSRVEDILAIFRQRYLEDVAVLPALVGHLVDAIAAGHGAPPRLAGRGATIVAFCRLSYAVP